MGTMRSATVLVVDDDPDLRELLAEALREEGYTVASASNGREALDLLERGLVPSVILLDLMMPVMNGFEFRAKQQATPALASIPVVVISAHSGSARPTGFAEAAGYLRKPFELDVMLETVSRHC